MLDVIKTPKTKVIELDKEYKLPAFDFNIMADIEEEFDCDIGEIQEIITKRKATNLRKLLWVLLRQNYDMKLEDAGKLITIQNVEYVAEKINEAMTGE